LINTTLARAADKPVVYDHITQGDTAVDQSINDILGIKYTIRPIKDSPAFVGAKVLSGRIPHTAQTDSGETLKGEVLLAYVITAEGRASDPAILKSSDGRLDAIVIQAMEAWRFAPAKLNGAPIATIAAQEFNFATEAEAAPAPRNKGFETTNIILYQKNDVLAQRMPSAEQLAVYIKELQSILGVYFADSTTPATFQTVVAVRPGRRVRVWFISSKPSKKPDQFAALRMKLESIVPIDVQGGPVAFAISGKLAGGDSASSQDDADSQPPIPQEWLDATKDLNPLDPLQVDDYLNAVWPDKK
jgi:TonB family protein